MDNRGKTTGAVAVNGLDLTGREFGRLLVIRRKKENTKSGSRRWQCVCGCGKFCIAQSNALTNGNKQSCGCLQKEAAKKTGNKNKCNGLHIDKDGYIIEISGGIKRGQHRRILEEKIGRVLTDDELPHHKDNDPTNNDPTNLELITRPEHIALHRTGGGYLLKSFIKYKMPTLNVAIAKAKSHPVAYSVFKKNWSDLCAVHFINSKVATTKVDVILTFIEPVKSRRDMDNVSHSQKYILDGLVMAGVIRDDSQQYIKSITTKFISAGKTYGVVVVVNEIREGNDNEIL